MPTYQYEFPTTVEEMLKMTTSYVNRKPSTPTEPHKRLICEVARDIKAAWPNPYFGAVPYLQAMLTMSTMQQDHGQDSPTSVILYFLSNAKTFRGEAARALKQELKTIADL